MDVKQQEQDKILSGLKEIRRKRRNYWVVSIASFCAFLAALAATGSHAVMIGTLVTVSVVNVVMFNRVCQSRCPRCGRLFHRPRPALSWHTFSSVCVHCGLNFGDSHHNLEIKN